MKIFTALMAKPVQRDSSTLAGIRGHRRWQKDPQDPGPSAAVPGGEQLWVSPQRTALPGSGCVSSINRLQDWGSGFSFHSTEA